MKKHNRRESGQSLSELAITFTLGLLLLGGAVDIGRAYFSYIAVRDAAQEGATYGAMFPTTSTSDVINRVRISSSSPVDLSNTSDILVTPVKTCGTNTYSVTVTYMFEPIMPITSTIFGTGGFPIRSTVTQTILARNCS
jgi:Flp pilus assembly protein TadG